MKSVIFKDKTVISSLIWRSVRWHFNYFFTKKPLPLACGLYITSKCNFKCSFCNIWRKPTTTLPLSKAKNIINNLSNLGCFYFSITGGEPLLVDYLFDLLIYARESKIKHIHLVTNGYLLDANRAIRLKETGINEISISIDGTEKVHDKNRGVPGSYSKAINAIENLKRYAPGVKIVLNAIFLPEDPFECLHVVDLARKFNIYAKVQPLNQHPVFNKNNHSVISPHQNCWCGDISSKGISSLQIKEAIMKLRSEDCVVNSNIFLDNIYNFFCQKEDLIFKDLPCIFGYHHIEILEDGSVFPCLEGLNWQKGINFNGNIKHLLRSSEYKQLLEKLKRCKGCTRNYYICYYEPRITFPINNLLRSVLHI